MTDNGDPFVSLIGTLVGRASDAAVSEVGASFDLRLQDARVLASAGERVAALEMLVSNLYEYDVALEPAEHEVLRELVDDLPVDSGTAQTMRLLVRRV